MAWVAWFEILAWVAWVHKRLAWVKVVDTQRLTKISKKNDFFYFDPPGIKI